MSTSSTSLNQAKTISLTPIQRLRSLVDHDLKCVDALIMEQVKSHVALIPDISMHTILSGGKRLRPMLTLAAAKICHYQGNDHVALATAVEFIHTATLLHDDVVDVSGMRRGKSTANNLWGNKESILVGDFLLGRAFCLMGEAKSLDVYRILSFAAMVISEGEVMQLVMEGNLEVDQEEYIEVIAAKTAELFAAASEIGAVLGNLGEHYVKALRNYGYYLGIAFQIVDDALDYSAKQTTLGKHIGDDFKESKITLPVLLAYKNGTVEQKEFWRRTITERQQKADDLETAIKYVAMHQGIAKSLDVAREYLEKASDALNVFPSGDIKQALHDVLDFVIERDY